MILALFLMILGVFFKRAWAGSEAGGTCVGRAFQLQISFSLIFLPQRHFFNVLSMRAASGAPKLVWHEEIWMDLDYF